MAALIEALPPGESSDPLVMRRYASAVRALCALTGCAHGYPGRFGPDRYDAAIRDWWGEWYRRNEPYLYEVADRDLPGDTTTTRVAIDWAAKARDVPTSVHRRDHPWLAPSDVAAAPAGRERDAVLARFATQVTLDALALEREPRAALGALAAAGTEEAAALLARVLPHVAEDTDLMERLSAGFLAHDARGAAVAVVLGWLESAELPVDPDPEAAAEGAAASDHDYAVDYLRFRIAPRERPGPSDFHQAQQLAGVRSDPERLDALLARLRDPLHGLGQSDFSLSDAVYLGGYVRDARVVHALERLLGSRRIGEPQRAYVAVALIRQGRREDEALALLRRLLCHPEPIVRLAAVESLWCVGRGDEGAPAVTEMLATLAERGPDLTRADDVPTATCRVDGCWLDAGGCFERRWPLRAGHDDREVAHLAAWLAGKVGAREAAPTLRSLARDLGGAWPILEVAYALARLDDPAGARHLLALANGEGAHLGRQAVECLERLGRRAVVPDLAPLLSATERETRLAAARAILVLLGRGRPAPEAAEAG